MALTIVVEINPGEVIGINEQNFSTRKEIYHDEWGDLFDNVLHAPVEIQRFEGEERVEYLDRRERLFREDLINKGYKMLGRIWYIFRDVFYSPSEVDALLQECMELKSTTESEAALSALEKLIFGCHEALRVKSGVSLICD
jgi:hypothetical protein